MEGIVVQQQLSSAISCKSDMTLQPCECKRQELCCVKETQCMWHEDWDEINKLVCEWHVLFCWKVICMVFNKNMLQKVMKFTYMKSQNEKKKSFVTN
jgi:hypothetical protein